MGEFKQLIDRYLWGDATEKGEQELLNKAQENGGYLLVPPSLRRKLEEQERDRRDQERAEEEV